MKIFEFNKYFPDEAACRKAFKEWRGKVLPWVHIAIANAKTLQATCTTA